MSDVAVQEPSNSPGLATLEHARLDALEDKILSALVAVEMPLRHLFTPGLYVRTIFMPAGTLCTSKVHRTEHPYAVLQGVAHVYLPGKGWDRVAAPRLGVTLPFTRRALLVAEDCVWATFHPLSPGEEAMRQGGSTEAELLAAIEARIIEPHRPEVHREYLAQLANPAGADAALEAT